MAGWDRKAVVTSTPAAESDRVDFAPLLTPMTAPPPTGSLSSPLVTAMADAPVRFMDGAAFDFFLIEMVETLRASSAHAQARARKVEQEMIDAGLLPVPLPTPVLRKERGGSTTSLASKTTTKLDDEEEGLRLRLEAIGMHVGANITERYALPLCPFPSHLTRALLIDYATENRTFLRHSKALSLFAKISGQRAGISKSTTSGQTIGLVSTVLRFPLSPHFGLGRVCITR